MIVSFISFIVVIAVCVLAHETGHYKTAKILGVQSHEFAFGMGPLIYQKKDAEGMLWSIRAFPIGGFVRIAGMGEEEDEEAVKPGMGFNEQPAWKRFFILANGSVMNIITAILLTAVFLYGHGVLDMQSARIGTLIPGMPAESAGFLPGDTILEINGKVIEDWRGMTMEIRQNAVEGSVNFKVERDGATFNLDVVIPVDQESKVPMLGITPSIKTYTLMGSITNAWSHIMNISIEMLRAIYKLITAEEAVDVTGPVGIAAMAGQAARAGIWSFLTFLSLISLNLGLLNLFPFPALDGGRLFLVLGEMIFRRRLPDKIERYIHFTGFVLLISLIVFVTWQDIVRLMQ
ncbi:MAG: RIP metalloprotease RseP [Synergistaceae bacterium]|nr:RIP metalloprotease RseP [Synergistaceae bacterium]